ncbi:Hypothetical protein EHI5A_014740 [Entamoeba histolytica KU27]|nr:Hypothetical protein EHI5A_014740 [Entamoeba histolytica KU27]ENY59877.1 hypothetical protein EHI7A_004670 [Entamoeba histolytica HM-1:IMSS-A]
MEESYGSIRTSAFGYFQITKDCIQSSTDQQSSYEIIVPPRNSNPIPMDSSFNFECGSCDSNASSYCGSFFQHDGFL